MLAQTPDVTVAVPAGWGWMAAIILVLALVAFALLFLFYRLLQNSEFISRLLGLPVSGQAPRRLLPGRRGEAARTTSAPVAHYGRKPAAAEFRFADEFLARRTEFWLLYAQFTIATFFVAAISGLMLIRAVEVTAGLPALSTVVGIVLGKTLLSAKGTASTAQEQMVQRGPINVGLPKIEPDADPPVVDTKLTADPGDWSGALPIAYTYAWRRRRATGETAIEGATDAVYTVVADDLGAALRVDVTAAGPSGSTTVTSPPLAIPAAPV